MADESSTDQFVLQYKTDADDILKKLQAVADKMDKVTEKGEQSESKFKGFGTNIGKNIGLISPEISGLISTADQLVSKFTGIGIVVAAIVVGFKSMNALMKEYNIQRDLSFKSGMSVNDIENFQRQINASSGGRIGADQSRGIIDRVQGLAFSAYTNPSPLSRESLLLREGGSSAFDKNGALRSSANILDDLSVKFKKATDTQAQAIGQTIGFTHDEVEAIRNRNVAVKAAANMTSEEALRRDRAAESMDRLKNTEGQLSETFRKIETDIAVLLIPAFDTILQWIDKSITWIPNLLNGVSDKISVITRAFDKSKGGTVEDFAKAARDVRADDKKRMDELNKQQSANNQDARASMALFTRDINLFSSAVSTFAGVIDEQQALAAWAGAVGQSAGVTNMALPTSRNTTSQYDAMIANAVKGTQVPAQVFKNLVGVESGFNPKAVSDQGAYGLAQIQQSNFKSLGITNPFDPQQSLNGGAKLLNQYLHQSGGDLEQALKMYHGGPNQNIWGAKTEAYPSQVMNYGASLTVDPNAPGYSSRGYTSPPRNINASNLGGTGSGGRVAGQTPNDVQLSTAQQAIAGQLGLDVGQLRLGRVNRGDIDFARQNLEYSAQIQMQKDQLMLTTPGALPRQIAQANADLRTQSYNLAAVRNYGSQVEQAGHPGGRSITLQERAVWIQIDGSQDPLVTGKAVKGALGGIVLSPDIDQMANSVTSGIKY